MTGSITYSLGNLHISRITEQVGLGYAPAEFYPDWDDSILVEHGDQLVPHCLDAKAGRFVTSIHSWVFRHRGKTILVDTCCGNDKDRPGLPRYHQQSGPYLQRLAAANIKLEEVDYVMCTHLHADHCGWNTRLIDGRWVPTFPNARYIFSTAEAEHWSSIGEADRLGSAVYADSVLPVIEAGMAMAVKGDEEFMEGLSFHPTPGHTPGHIALSLRDGKARALFTGDIMHQPVQVYRPAWNSVFCSDPEAARRSRRWALETAVETGATVFTAHFAASSAGHVTERAGKFDWRHAWARI